jgi:hypothetical protein
MTTNTNTKLASSDDWVAWFNVLKTKAKNQDLWVYIDPLAENKPSLASNPPTKPDIRSMKKKGPRTRAVTAEGTPSTQGSSVTLQEEDPLLGADADDSQRANEISDLSAANLQTYNSLWTLYKHLLSEHENLKKRTAKVQDWVLETVDEPLARHHCSADNTLADWVKSLYEEFSLAAADRKWKARKAYRNHLAKPRRSRLTSHRALDE